MSNYSSLFAVKPVNITSDYSKYPFNPMNRQNVTYQHSSNWISAAISAAGGLLGSIFGDHSAKKSAQLQYNYNRQLAEQQFGYNKQLMAQQYVYNQAAWNYARGENRYLLANEQQYNKDMMALQNQYAMQNWQTAFDAENAYNDPASQRQRLEDAGYNPQLANGTVNTLAGNGINSMPSSSNPSASAPSPYSTSLASSGLPSVGLVDISSNIKNIVGAATDVVNTAVQYGLSKHQAKKIAQDTSESQARTIWQDMLNKISNSPYIDEAGQTIPDPATGEPMTLESARQQGLARNIWKLFDVQQSEFDLNQGKSILQGILNDEETKKNTWLYSTLSAAYNQMVSAANLNNASANAINSKLPYEIANIKQDTKTKAASASLSKAQADDIYTKIHSGYYAAQVEQLRSSGKLNRAQYDMIMSNLERIKDFNSSDYAKNLEYVSQTLGAIGNILGGGMSLLK